MQNLCPPELKKLYQSGRVLPFVGAGASMAVSWERENLTQSGPSWSQIVDQAIKMLGYDDPELLRMRGTDLQILEYFRVKKGELAPLVNWLVKRMDTKDDALGASRLHRSLGALTLCPIYYTTNYDDFLERSLFMSGRQTRAITGERDMGFGHEAVQVVKFHGDFNSPANMVMSELHYYDRMRLDNVMDLKLRSDLLGRAVLFIGYSFRDPNIAYLFQTINSLFKKLPNSPSGKRAYIIINNPSDFEYTLFNERNIQVIPTINPNISDGVAEIIEDMGS